MITAESLGRARAVCHLSTAALCSGGQPYGRAASGDRIPSMARVAAGRQPLAAHRPRRTARLCGALATLAFIATVLFSSLAPVQQYTVKGKKPSSGRQSADAAASASESGGSRDGTDSGNGSDDGSSRSSETADVRTGVHIAVLGKDGKPDGTTMELLNEPVPEDCHMEGHADYEGFALTWGQTYHVASAAQCCQRCKEMAPREDGRFCNVWVFCGDVSGRCWSRDMWNYTTGECWLKSQKDWDGLVPPAATNLKVKGRGPNNDEDRRLYGAPELVAWTAGVVVPRR